jgi:hypothetical protein
MNDVAAPAAAQHAGARVIVIVGIHRSGTSLTDRALAALGVRLAENLLPGRSDNPAGFFEHREILAETTAVDRTLGIAPFGNGHIVPPEDTDWRAPALSERAAALGAVVARESAAAQAEGGVFGFKDPRTAYLLPL